MKNTSCNEVLKMQCFQLLLLEQVPSESIHTICHKENMISLFKKKIFEQTTQTVSLLSPCVPGSFQAHEIKLCYSHLSFSPLFLSLPFFIKVWSVFFSLPNPATILLQMQHCGSPIQNKLLSQNQDFPIFNDLLYPTSGTHETLLQPHPRPYYHPEIINSDISLSGQHSYSVTFLPFFWETTSTSGSSGPSLLTTALVSSLPLLASTVCQYS